MKMQKQMIRGAILVLVLGGTVAHAQVVVNQWRGGGTAEQWNDPYKWKQNHAPTGEESAHFREPLSVITVNSTVQLNNGMHLYGEELSLQGNGNINLWNQVPHSRTINIPASATGFANLTLNDNLSVNARVALSAKGFGTSASKGSITLKDRTNVTGALSVGNAGTGTGQVYVKEHSTYRITGLELSTKATAGGSAEIHILGGTVLIETKENPFKVFLEDPSRKLILGDAGTLRFEYNLSVAEKKEAIKSMIIEDRLVAAPGCQLTTPIIQDKLVMIRAEDKRNGSPLKSKEELIASIDDITAATSVASTGSQPRKIESLLKTMGAGEPTSTAAPAVAAPAATPGNASLAALMQQKGVSAETATPAVSDNSGQRMAGYIAFFGAVFLVLRRSPVETEEKPKQKKRRKR
ncbi:hypothetical protein P4C99_13990 [Pontiellaceae bacterium B1224]|nr:hypothetical protein [Pontiellaceae bacterium B1224]